MKELSLNILDITQNSISAGASLITIEVNKNVKENKLTISIADNGKGMSEDFAAHVCDPFVTTRTTRKVGMGIPLLKLASEQAGGRFEILSSLGVGTTVTATFVLNHIDRLPLGDIGQTVSMLVSCNESVDFVYRHISDGEEFCFDTREIRAVLNGVPFNEPEVVLWMQDYIKEGIASVNGEV